MPMTDIPIPPPLPPEASEDKLDGMIAAISLRCSTAKIDVTVEPNPVTSRLGRNISVHLPNGHNKRRVYLTTVRAIERLMAEPFETITFLGEYEAVCDYQADYMEAYIGPFRGMAVAVGGGLGVFGKNADGTPKVSLDLFSPHAQTSQKITVGPTARWGSR